MRDSSEFSSFAQKQRMNGQGYTHAMYEEMKKAKQKERVVREDQDPDILREFQKINIDRLFAEFNARPMRQSPGEMGEDFM
jgi:hypothetical protein